MAAAQLRLLEAPHPFCERWDCRFFRSVPKAPGVYQMHGRPHPGRNVVVLYVGKAANLRQRLSSYRSAATTSVSRKTRRLLARVDEITWEVCGSEREALLRENELIQELRPKFNRVQTWPQGYWYVGYEVCGSGLELRVTHEPLGSGDWFGAFKSRHGFSALARCLWAAQRPDAERPPGRWFDWDTPRELRLVCSNGVSEVIGGDGSPRLSAYFAGQSDELIDALAGWLLRDEGLTLFDRSWRDQDLEALREFYRRGPCRNRVWAERMGCPNGLIPKERLDALILGEPA